MQLYFLNSAVIVYGLPSSVSSPVFIDITDFPSHALFGQVLPDKFFFIPKALFALPQPDSRMNCARDTDAKTPLFFWSAVNSGPIFSMSSLVFSPFSSVACIPFLLTGSALLFVYITLPASSYTEYPLGQFFFALSRTAYAPSCDFESVQVFLTRYNFAGFCPYDGVLLVLINFLNRCQSPFALIADGQFLVHTS